MTRDEVVELMASSRTGEEWDENADRVKAAHDDGYPDYWFQAIILDGVHDRVRVAWDSGPRIKLYVPGPDGKLEALPIGREGT